MDIMALLQSAALFEGLNDTELRRIASICEEARYQRDQVITVQGQPGDEMFIVRDGQVEVSIAPPTGDHGEPPRSIVHLGTGQVVGEMALVDGGPRSATARSVTEVTTMQVIKRAAFERLCESNHHIGLIVYRNLAADLSFKLRHHHLARR